MTEATKRKQRIARVTALAGLLAELVIVSGPARAQSGGAAVGYRSSPAQCLREVDQLTSCSARHDRNTVDLPLELLVDKRYLAQHSRQRLERTLTCMNSFFRPAGIHWDIKNVRPWSVYSPGYDLQGLLHQVENERRHVNTGAIWAGIVLWQGRQLYSRLGRKIGISRGGASIVSSWPRVENDCFILAHELAHLVGAVHGRQRGPWIMNSEQPPYYLPSSNGILRVQQNFRFHPRDLVVMSVYRLAALGPRGLSLNAGCRAFVADVDRCYGLR